MKDELKKLKLRRSGQEEISFQSSCTGETRIFEISRYFSNEREEEEYKILQKFILDTRYEFFGGTESDKDLELFELFLGKGPCLTKSEDAWILKRGDGSPSGSLLLPFKEWFLSFNGQNAIHGQRENAMRLLTLKIALSRLLDEEHPTFKSVLDDKVSLGAKTELQQLTIDLFEDYNEDGWRQILGIVARIGLDGPLSPFPKLDFVSLTRKGKNLNLWYAHYALEGECSPFDRVNLIHSCGNIEWAECVLNEGGMFGPDGCYKYEEIKRFEDGRYYVQMSKIPEEEYLGMGKISFKKEDRNVT